MNVHPFHARIVEVVLIKSTDMNAHVREEVQGRTVNVGYHKLNNSLRGRWKCSSNVHLFGEFIGNRYLIDLTSCDKIVTKY